MYKQFFPAECKDGHKGDTCRGIIQKYEDQKRIDELENQIRSI